MIRIDIPKLVARFNPISKQILETTASTCVSQQESEITVAHYLLECLNTPLCDIRAIFDKANLSYDAVKKGLENNTYRQGKRDDTPAFSPLLIEWFKDALLLSTAELNQSTIRTGTLLLALLDNPARYLSTETVKQLQVINVELVKNQFTVWTQGSAENERISEDQENSKYPANTDPSLLNRYAANITAQAREGKLDPVLCRDEEIDLMIDILCRRRKNNPIVVGEAGVGKSALIEGLALRIINGDVPDKLRGTELMNLDLGALQAGASVKGEFEKRFKGVMAEVMGSPTPIILFIDEAHTVIGAGNNAGGLDISNLLKPALARGELKTIAATTWSEYKKYFEKDAALSRRFQLVKVNEPSAQEAIVIMRGLRHLYEKSHSVLIDDDALQAAALLSDRYLSGRQLPDKAIDVLDTACARVAINLTSPPRRISALKNTLHQLQAESTLLEREHRLGLNDFTERLASLEAMQGDAQSELTQIDTQWQQQQTLVHQIIALRTELLTQTDVQHSAEDTEVPEQADEQSATLTKLAVLTDELNALQKQDILVSPHVNKTQIASVIAEWTGVPLNQISQDELKVVTQLPDYLNKSIKGQDLAIAHLHRHLLTSRADLRRPGRPLGAFLLVGPSGVGKTETVLQIADLLFGGRQYLTTINMSEFQEKHTVSRLIGSPPGYVGYGEGGVLTEAIRQKPYSVVLLDEVEKAHPDVLNLFYQAFDKGELADGEGRIIDCKNIVFFLTSNLGYQTIVNYAEQPDAIIDHLYQELADFFKPALLARMEVIPYLPLSPDTLKSIITDKLLSLDKILRQRFSAEVVFTDDVASEILSRSTRTENGARMLESIIDGALLPPVSLLLLNKLSAGEPISTINFTVADNQFIARVE
ncbi:MAG: type VI secretion system ATPase TssH [Enterobacteriaceae bacterium]|jgi:type VI secretion system protein VasG|nr:type VI secretion system ATPase TssH [Enterobacteriaceae bacterium]